MTAHVGPKPKRPTTRSNQAACAIRLIADLTAFLPLERVLDAGCGDGELDMHLAERGFKTVGVDARPLTVHVARARHPGAQIEVADVEADLGSFGMFDLVVCVELLEHLESPLRALQQLAGVSRAGLFVAGWLLDTRKPVFELVGEPYSDDAALRGVACVPAESAVVEALKACGFEWLYRRRCKGSHGAPPHGRRWTEILALRGPLPEPDACRRGLQAVVRGIRSGDNREGGIRACARLIRGYLPSWLLVPRRLPIGGWCLEGSDSVSSQLRAQRANVGEWLLLARLVRPGSTVLDATSSGGFYAVLLGRCTGPDGLVIAFEPLVREARRLRLNLWLNRLRNVRVEPLLVFDRPGDMDHDFLVEPDHAAAELRIVAAAPAAERHRVTATTIDHAIERAGVCRLDVIRLDLGGAELAALMGARVTVHRFRPVVFCRMHDAQTRARGYDACDIRTFLSSLGYEWFHITLEGHLLLAPPKRRYNEMLVAVPAERVGTLTPLMEWGTAQSYYGPDWTVTPPHAPGREPSEPRRGYA